MEFVEELGERIAANRILNRPFDLQIKYESRLLNNLKTLRKEYEELQKKDLGGRQSSSEKKRTQSGWQRARSGF